MSRPSEWKSVLDAMMTDTFEFFIHLSQSIAVMLALTFIYSLLTPALRGFIPRMRVVLQGMLFGVFGIFAMLTSTPFAPGFLIDGRNIIVAIAGVSGGPVAALITTMMVGVFRLSLGGGGAVIALASSLTAALLGCGLWWYQQHKPSLRQGRALLVLGVAIALERTLWSIVLGGETGQKLAVEFFFPTFVLFTLGTWLLGISLSYHRQHSEVTETLVVERAMLRTLIDNVPDYIFIKDRAGRFILSNIAHAHAAGAATVDDLLGKTAQEFFPQSLAAQYNLDDQRVMHGETIIAEERQTIDKAGEPIWVTTTKVPIHSQTGQIVGIVGISRNITQRKRAEEALRESERKFRQIVETASEGICIVDIDYQITFANPRVAAMLGYSVDEMLGRQLLEFMDVVEREPGTSARERAEVSEERDFKFRTKDGRALWAILSTALMTNDEEEVTGALIMITDITERKQGEKKFRALLESAPDAMVVVDQSGEIMLINERTEKLFGYTRAELMGKSVDLLIPEEHRGSHPSHRSTYTADPHVRGMGVGLELHARGKDGTRFPVEISLSPIEIEGGVLVASAIRDITERKQAEAQALELAAAQQRVQVLKRFMIDMSHDFRTPLSVIQTSVFLLKRTASEQQQRRLDILEAQTERLTMLLEALNEVYELENKDQGWQSSPSDVNEALEQIIKRIMPKANEKQLRVQFFPGVNLPPILLARSQFESAITQIVNNALCYTPVAGQISISTVIEKGQLVITVQDTGIGIKPKDLPHIFEHFYRADQARSTETGGNGLGLAIAQKIINAHGGEITVESTPGQGSMFRVLLPIEESVPTSESMP